MSSASTPAIGIDLGTTNSVVAVVKDGKPIVIEEDGEKLLPSVVGLDASDKLITGTTARNQLAAFPDRTVASIKRKMGTMDAVELGSQSFTPPEISAMILRRICDRASRALGISVDRAVITVPAFFDENQRQATREAGELAGLTVERIINEPTAASLVYHAGSRDAKQIVVYDFGGGTFDVSVVRMEDGVVEVLSSKGDTNLGGDDIDIALLDHIADQFQEHHGIDLRATPTQNYRLRQACERAKVVLSTESKVAVTEEFIAEKDGQPLNLNIEIERSEFEELIAPFIERTIKSVDEALADSGLTLHQMDDLVLVGGSTRIPLVQQRLREEYQREPSRAVDPDLAVALGAAVQAAMLDGQVVGPVLVDVTGHTLGIEAVMNDSFFSVQTSTSPIIHRNSPLPARHEQTYYTMHPDQENVEIHVLQGEHVDVDRNRSIGRFKLELQKQRGENSQIVVRFDLTLDGTLHVTATQSGTGKREELSIQNALSQFQADDREKAEARLGAMFDTSDELIDDADLPKPEAGESKGGNEQPSKYPRATELIAKATELLADASDEDSEDIQKIREDLQKAIDADDSIAVDQLTEELDDIIFYIQ